ncbi:MAG: hypothetical protein NTX25_08750, partial [Proteobacteria bacterium]|nr:hypothetical protein [Pseudomonadota bacterium]
SPILHKRLKNWLLKHEHPSLEDWMGLGGISKVYYSPMLVRSLVQQHKSLIACFSGAHRPMSHEEFPQCWDEDLGSSAVVVKAAWQNVKAPFFSYDTSAPSLEKIMSQPSASWQDIAIQMAVPASILAAQLDNERVILPALHIMSRDRKDWLWVSVFWSNKPDDDFGEDRPAAVKALGAPFDQYKICVVASFEDEAEDLDELALHAPQLVAAYRSAMAGNPGSSWCSNPYLEFGQHNQRSNCIGCHQFAGTSAKSEAILNEPSQFPSFGSRKERFNFPVDYIWSVAAGQESLLNTFTSLMDWRISQDNKFNLETAP